MYQSDRLRLKELPSMQFCRKDQHSDQYNEIVEFKVITSQHKMSDFSLKLSNCISPKRPIFSIHFKNTNQMHSGKNYNLQSITARGKYV